MLDGALRVFARGSLLEPLVELAGVQRARVEQTPLRAELVLDYARDRAVISLGFGELELIEELLVGLRQPDVASASEVAAREAAHAPATPTAAGPEAAGPSPAGPSAAVSATEDRPLAAELLATLESAQRTFLGVLGARRRALQKNVTRTKPASKRPREPARTPHKRAAPVHDPIPEATREASETPEARSPTTAWIVLIALIVIGIGSAMRRLILSP